MGKGREGGRRREGGNGEWKEERRKGRGEREEGKGGERGGKGKKVEKERGRMWVHIEQVYNNNELLTGSANLALATVDWSLVLFRTCSGGVRS